MTPLQLVKHAATDLPLNLFLPVLDVTPADMVAGSQVFRDAVMFTFSYDVCRVPVSVGAVHCERHYSPEPSSWPSQYASSESLAIHADGQTDNNMRRLGTSGCASSVMALIAKPMPRPQAEIKSNLCYCVEWQVRLWRECAFVGSRNFNIYSALQYSKRIRSW